MIFWRSLLYPIHSIHHCLPHVWCLNHEKNHQIFLAFTKISRTRAPERTGAIGGNLPRQRLGFGLHRAGSQRSPAGIIRRRAVESASKLYCLVVSVDTFSWRYPGDIPYNIYIYIHHTSIYIYIYNLLTRMHPQVKNGDLFMRKRSRNDMKCWDCPFCAMFD